MATALVTGATGFVGSWIARVLCEAGHEVRILRRRSSRLDAIADLDIVHFIGDVNTLDGLEEAVAGVDWVFHVAAVSSYWRSNADEIYRVNVDGTRLLLEVCERAEVSRFIFTSSAASIGFRSDGQAVNEEHHLSIDPRLSAYGHSKFLAEAEVYQAIERGMDAVILNPSVVLGPGDLNLISGSLVLEIARKRSPFMPAQGGVTLVDVRDVAKAHLAAAEHGELGERYLLGTVNMSHKALFRLIAQIVGVDAPIIPAYRPMINVSAMIVDACRTVGIQLPGDVEGNQLRLSQYDIYFDCSKARHNLHESEVDITQSIADTYHWYRENGFA